ncbi:MAG: aminoacetone oxidase family FAD-binding enzyme, partial [Moraxellaceae bacterium]|nr:aminoacetone oxidase family FAD-binding enzyme [Moraxellaceae bacterium]
MCALQAGQRGRRVLVLDRSNKVGKKILMSGGGRCNFMNLAVEPDNFLSANPHFCISALNRYTQWDFLALVDKHGIAWHERKHGQLFCNDSAKDILNMLLVECEKARVTIRTQCEVESISATSGNFRFQLATSLGAFQSESLVVATGGLSIPTMGASGFGYEIARQFGHSILPTRAGLVPFMFSDGFKAISERLSGLAHEATVENERASFTENILFTHRGLSGPAVLQLSSYWLPGESVQVNLFPGEDIHAWLLERKRAQPRSLLRTPLTERLAKSLV